MPRLGKMIAALLALLSLASVFAPSAARAEKRIALVIGNAGYQAAALTTPANDAGLIAQTLEAAGFDVAGARDLDQDSLRRTFRDFVEKATNAGPDTVAFIYVSGYGLQLEGENYIVPVDAKIARDSDVAAQALRLSDYTRPLAALKLKTSIVVLDAARANPFARSGPPLAGGLALVEPEPGVLMAFNAAPGTVAPEGQGPYGPYAQALAEMIRDGGLPLAAVFDRARLRVNDVTKGAQVPWHASKVETSFVFFERAPDAPPPAVSNDQAVALRAQPMRDLPPQEAYAAALDRDTLDGYSEFITAYPDDPMARRVRAIIAARREALTWRRTRLVDTPPAYWSYLRRYPQGPHAPDARRRLAFLAAVLEPPPSFAMLAYDLPPPPPEEIVYIRRPVLVFDDPVFAFAPPPPPPIVFLSPPPPEFVLLPPPPPPVALFVLPIPVYRPVPVWVRPPAYVAPPPPNNVIYTNVHNTVVVNNVTNTVTITNPSGQTQTVTPAAAPAASPSLGAPAASPPGAPSAAPAPAPAPAAVGPALPPSVAQKAATLQSQSPQGLGAPTSASPPAANQLPGQPGQQPLPGRQGRPLPSATPGTAAATPSGPATNAKPGGSPTTPGGAAPTTPTAAVAPGTPPSPSGPATNAKPGGPPTQSGAAPAATTPSAAIAPSTPTPTRGKRGAPPSQVPAAKLTPPSSPSNATAPATPAPAKPSAAITPATPSSTPAPGGAAKPPQKPAAPHVPPPPAAKLTPPPASPPPPNVKPAPPPVSPPPAAKLAPPPPPAAKPVTPPPAPAAAAAKPAPSPPGPKVAQPQPKGCPPGKTAAVVNGHPTCK